MSNKLVVSLIVLSILLAITTFSSCSIAYRNKVARDKEMIARLELEERMSVLASTRGAVAPERASEPRQPAQQDVAESDDDLQKALVQEQIANQGLREEVGRLTSQVKTLEDKLQELLTAD